MASSEELKTHQIQLRLDQKTRRTVVSCVCRASELKHARGKTAGEYYEPIGMLGDGQTMWDLYNDPSNHWVDFSDEDKVRV